MVIVITGILAAVVGPRFFDRQVFDERLFFEESLSAARYAQKLAVASGCPVRVQIPVPNVENSGYGLTYSAPCSGAVAGDFNVQKPTDVTIQQSLDITFSSLGCVSSTNTCPSTGAASTAEIGGFIFKVHLATGFIETMP